MNDLLGGCNTEGLTVEEFEATFCRRCKQPECRRAAWGHSLMDQRIRRQVKSLLHPDQADPALSKYAHLGDFEDMLEHGMRMAVADKKRDWEVPEIPIRDGVVEVTAPDLVDAAVRAMSRSQEAPKKAKVAEKAPPEPEPEPTPEPEPKPRQPVRAPVAPKVVSTPATQGVMIGGGPPPEPEPEVDPWAPPEKPPAKKVPVGATIKMGGK